MLKKEKEVMLIGFHIVPRSKTRSKRTDLVKKTLAPGRSQFPHLDTLMMLMPTGPLALTLMS